MELIADSTLFEAYEREDVSKVMACIDMLSEAQRNVIIMYYLYDRSLKEITQQ